jgi:teichuronic acid exporter
MVRACLVNDYPPVTTARHSAIERFLALAWSGVENSCRQILSLIFFFISVRFLGPTDLGTFALALAVNSVPMIFIDEMVGESLVQHDEATRDDWDTGFTVNLAIALVFLVLSILLSWPIAAFLGQPALQWAIPILSLASILGALGNIQKAYLARILKFQMIAQYALIGQVVSGIVAVFLAIEGFGYWALLENVLGGALVCTIGFSIASPWKPRLRWCSASITARRTYAVHIAAMRLIYLGRDQLPMVVTGLMFGVAEAGYFSLAMRVGRSLGLLFEEVATRPLLSILSREQHDLRRFGSVLTVAITAIGMAALPAYFGLALAGPLILPVVFGPKWAAAAAYVPYVCVILGSWLILHVAAVSLRARSLSHFATTITGLMTVVDSILFICLAHFGLQVSLTGWAARSVLSIPLAARIFRRYLGVSLQRLILRSTAPLVATVALIGCLLACRTFELWQTREAVLLLLALAGLAYVIPLLSLRLIERKWFTPISGINDLDSSSEHSSSMGGTPS